MENESELIKLIVYPDLYARQSLKVRSVLLLIVEGILQRTHKNTNIISHRLVAIEGMSTVCTYHPTDTGPDAWHVPDEGNPQIIQLDRPSATAGPRSAVEIRAIAPDAQSYH